MSIKYFTTGEFAKLCNINKKTLFHYDDIDLFKPEKVLSNGYRYYSEYQLEVFDVIRILKDIGMPLKNIKGFLDKRNPENIIELFEYEINEMEKEIIKLQKKQEVMLNKISIIKEGRISTNKIELQQQSEDYILLSNPVDNSKDSYDMENYIALLDYCYEKNLNIGYPVGAIMSKENLKKKNYSNYSYYFIKVNENTVDKKVCVKPKGIYVTSYLHGYYDELPNLYKSMERFIDENSLRIVGSAYEEVMHDAVVAKNMNNYIIKVSIQVESSKDRL